MPMETVVELGRRTLEAALLVCAAHPADCDGW